ncbi:MAG: hypothetical protein Q9159_006387 [Coniocarpon cinnabarinum]
MVIKDTQTHGRRLLVHTIDEIARIDPDRTWALKPHTLDLEDGYRKVTFRELANAVNILAWFLDRQLGDSNKTHTFAYLGKPDMRYYMISAAAAKTGNRVLFSSHLNSLAAHLNLIRKTECTVMVSTHGVKVNDILDGEPLKHVIAPELDELLDAPTKQQYTFPKSFDEAKFDEYLILHTSGTTGLPKPITYNNWAISVFEAQCSLPEVDPETGFRRALLQNYLNGPVLSGFAPFHGLCVGFLFPLMVYGNMVQVWCHPDRLTTFEDTVGALKHAPLTAAIMPPHLLEELARSGQYLTELAKLKHVVYGGAMLNPTFANILVTSGVKLANWWGSSETGTVVHGALPPEDWMYVCLDDFYSGIEWRPASGDHGHGHQGGDLYELFLVRRPESDPYSMCFARSPDHNEWAPGDLWEKHPTKEKTWRYYGRADDLICFSNGLKLHPLDIENQLNSHPLVRSSLLFGSQHAQVVALVELNEKGYQQAAASGVESVRDSIWARAQDINKETQKVAQIAKSHILLVKQERPLPRASKGSLQRVHAIREYMPEIDETYVKHGDQVQQDLMDRVQNGALG